MARAFLRDIGKSGEKLEFEGASISFRRASPDVRYQFRAEQPDGSSVMFDFALNGGVAWVTQLSSSSRVPDVQSIDVSFDDALLLAQQELQNSAELLDGQVFSIDLAHDYEVPSDTEHEFDSVLYVDASTGELTYE